MNPLAEAKEKLEIVLGADLMKEYLTHLKKWVCFKEHQKYEIEFDSAVRKLMTTSEQIHLHYHFLNTLKTCRARLSPTIEAQSTSDKRGFEPADYTESIPSSNPVLPAKLRYRSAAAGLFLPDSSFIATRIALYAWDHHLKGAEDGVTELVVEAVQVFVGNGTLDL